MSFIARSRAALVPPTPARATSLVWLGNHERTVHDERRRVARRLRGAVVLAVPTPGEGLRAATMPPWAPLATHLGESIFDLAKGARVCRAQLGLEGFLDDVRDRCPPQLVGVREPHVDDCQVAAEPWPVLLELVEDGVVGQHDSERRQALVQVVEVVDEGAHLLIPNSIPTRLRSPPRSAGGDSGESGRRCLNDEVPVDRREHVRSMTVGLREGKGAFVPARREPREPHRRCTS
jgi:hypothetical protein